MNSIFNTGKTIIPFTNPILFKAFKKLAYTHLQSEYLKNFYEGISYPEPTRGRILMYVGIGHMYLTPIEVLIYHLLRQEGYQVDYYIYDTDVPINEVITNAVIGKTGKEVFWTRSVKNARRFLDASKVEYKFIEFPSFLEGVIGSAKEDLDKILAFEFEGVQFGNIVRGVMYRFYKSLNFGDDALPRAYEFLKTALANYFQVKKLCEQSKYSYLFFSHGIYCTWEPLTAYCKRNSIPFVCYDRAKRNGSANFNLNQPSPDWSIDFAWEKFRDKQLTAEEEKMVDNYLKERELQKGDVYAYNSVERSGDVNGIKQKLGIKKDARVITIFTNLIWDAANVARDIAFSSALDCIVSTINHYKDREDVHILIRCHPAEKVLGTQERYGTLVRNALNDLPYNVAIIEPEMDINSFSVIDVSTIGVVNTSTVGLEFAMAGKPIVLISDTHYRNKGFTYDVTSEDNYFSTLNSLLTEKLERISEQQVQLSRKYFYMMMFLYQKNMPVKYKNNLFNGYSVQNINRLNQADPLYQIINSLEKEPKDFVFWN